MAYFDRSWTLESVAEQLHFLKTMLETEDPTRDLAPPVEEFLVSLEALLQQKKEARAEQVHFLLQLRSADRLLDLALSGLSGQVRLLERAKPTGMRLVSRLFPEGVKAYTHFSGRGVETEARMTRSLLAVLAQIPEAEPLREAAEAVSFRLEHVDAALAGLAAADERVTTLRREEDLLRERAYTLFNNTHAQLLIIYNNARRFVAGFFLD